MRESNQLIDTLKSELRRQGRTYADLASVLDLSHASVKRLFAERNFTLARVEAICRYLGMDMAEMMRLAESNAERLHQLSLEQEQELVKDEKLLCMAHAVLCKWRFEDVIGAYTISEHEGIRLLARLDRMRLIEMLPGNRYRLLVSRKFTWIPSGPIQAFFEQQLQADYFQSSFNKENEVRLFVSTTLSQASANTAIALIRKLTDEINELHLADEKLPLAQRRGISFLLAARPWETRVFAAMRRKS